MGIRTALEHGGTGTVAEEDARVAVFPIDDRGKFFGPDDEHGFVGARHDELLADLESVNETRTRGLEIERGGAGGPEFLLHETGRRRERHVGRDRGDDDEVDLVGGDAGFFQRALGGFGTEVGGEFVFSGDAAFLDAGAGGDPLVGGLDEFFEFGVGENARGKIRTDAHDGAGAADEIVLGARVSEGPGRKFTHAFAGAGGSTAAEAMRALAWVISLRMT